MYLCVNNFPSNLSKYTVAHISFIMMISLCGVEMHTHTECWFYFSSFLLIFPFSLRKRRVKSFPCCNTATQRKENDMMQWKIYAYLYCLGLFTLPLLPSFLSLHIQYFPAFIYIAKSKWTHKIFKHFSFFGVGSRLLKVQLR